MFLLIGSFKNIQRFDKDWKLSSLLNLGAGQKINHILPE